MPRRVEAVLPEVLERQARERPEQVFAVFDDGTTYRYREVAERTWTIAGCLREQLEIAEGEVVASWLPNGPEAMFAWFATNAAGAVFAPLNTAYKGALLEHSLNLIGARVMIVHADLVDRLAPLELVHLETVIVVDDHDERATSRFRELGWMDLLAGPRTERPRLDRPREPWDDMAILMTSGTTGASKAVRRTYVHYDLYTEVNFRTIGAGPEDRFYVCAPMFHGGADTPLYSMLQLGGSIGVSQVFSASGFWDACRELECTIAWIHSSMSLFLHKQPLREDDADNPVRFVMMAPLIEGFDEFSARFGVRVYMLYGMTEIPCVFRVIDPVERRDLALPADPGYEVRIVDEHDLPIERPHEAGEMVLRHATPWAISPGYLGDSAATARVWRNGWFHTGDVFARDERGHFYLVDRVKDSIRRRGENVSAAEVETELLAHPEVTEAAVIGVPAELDEEIFALVVARQDARIGPEDLHAHLVERLPYFAVPRYIQFVGALPRNPALRVDKPALRDRGLPADAWDRDVAGVTVGRERFRAQGSGS